jgi:glycosyltransferase involved in cell wall biosynthesis
MKGRSEDPVIHVVVPTGGRAETIGATLLSCHQQTYDRMVVWICDNSFEEQTESIVNSFSDERFRLIRPDGRLCMAENWEFAIAHLTEGFVTIIGDDDGLMPDCLTKVSDVIKAYPTIPVINHLPGNYFWPNYPDPNLANKLQIRPMDFAIEVIEAKPVLARVCTFTEWYGRLPFLYHGFVCVEHINKIKARTNTPFFSFCAPDIYSDIVLALHTEKFVVVGSALTLGGQSAKSNGANYARGNNLAKQFINELPEHLRFTYESKSISLAIFNAIEIAFRAFPEESNELTIDFERLLINAIDEASQFGEDALEELYSKLELLYSPQAIQGAIESRQHPGIEAIPEQVPARSLTRRIASRLRKIISGWVPKPTAGTHLPDRGVTTEPTVSISSQDPLEWENGSVTAHRYIDLKSHDVTTVHQAALYLSARLKDLLASR